MDRQAEPYRKTIYLSIVLIALGVVYSTTLKDQLASFGTVFIALGGLFLIIGMRRKAQEREKHEK